MIRVIRPAWCPHCRAHYTCSMRMGDAKRWDARGASVRHRVHAGFCSQEVPGPNAERVHVLA